MGSATAEGPDRAEKAARAAINSPLLDGVSIRGARNVLVNISAGSNLGMRETTTATNIIHEEAGENAEIILGTVLDETFGEEIRVTVISTGFELAEDRSTAKVAGNKEPSLNKAAQNAQANIQNQRSKKESDVPDRFPRGTGDYYKGENNLKKLDTPSYLRRDLNVRKQEENVEVPDEEEQQGEAQDNIAPFQSRTERIRKDDTEQPAFLRKIMD
jgi:cell division protein FtsZ